MATPDDSKAPEVPADDSPASAAPDVDSEGVASLAPNAGDPSVNPSATGPLPSTLAIPAILPVVQVRDLDWEAIRKAVDAGAIRARLRSAVESMEALLDTSGGPGMLFDGDRANAGDRAIRISSQDDASPLWIIGDLHGDLLALEASLAQIQRDEATAGSPPARIIFLGDFFDDEGFGLEILVRVFELIVQTPQRICVIAGNHDEALSYDGGRFASSVSPSDFADFLNANLAHEWIERAGKLAVRMTARSPRALFFPDGLMVAHGGFPLTDLHAALASTGDWNDPACLSDFVWARAHPKARRKMPNRFSRGSQFGHEDFDDFCSLAAKLGRPVTHMVRGHDHVEARYAIYPAYRKHPVLTTVALCRRLNRERLGSYERASTLARVVPGCVPQVYQLFIPSDLINAVFPQPANDDESESEAVTAVPS